jgi:hypothetical protein
MNYEQLKELFYNEVFQEQEPTFGEDGRQHGLYVIQNLINGKFYVGKHSRDEVDDYFGSGVALKRAVRKYGKPNFQMKYFHWSESAEQLHDDETEVLEILLNEIFEGDWQELKKCAYNLKLNQGFNSMSDETRAKMSGGNNPMFGKGYLQAGELNPMFGRTGELNPMFGRTGDKTGKSFIGITIGINNEQEVVCFNGGQDMDSRQTRSGKFFQNGNISYVINGRYKSHHGFTNFFRTKSVDVLQNYLETATFYDEKSREVLINYLSSVAETS